MIAGHASKRVTILGVTGSIGRNTASVLQRAQEAYAVEAVTGGNNVAELAIQAKTLGARHAVIANESLYGELKAALSGSNIEAAAGEQALIEAAQRPADWVMSAMVGAAGLRPTMAAIQTGATVALANKECLVCAGDLMIKEVQNHNATLIPVDSEHSAIFQVFDRKRPESVAKIVLTASGGPFWRYSTEQMKTVTLAQAVAHPNWSMGAKISVDSATMMNKGLEIIEAFHLFPVKEEQIDVVVHPESVVHSLVEYVDGSVLAQLGTPDMCTPIAVALAWPERLAIPHKRLNLLDIGRLTFEPVDEAKFPCLALARAALKSGGSAPAVLNAANEVAVACFTQGRIGFLDIAVVVEETLASVPTTAPNTLEDVLAIIETARQVAEALVEQRAAKAA